MDVSTKNHPLTGLLSPNPQTPIMVAPLPHLNPTFPTFAILVGVCCVACCALSRPAQHYNMSETLKTINRDLNAIFTALFTLEAALKIAGYGFRVRGPPHFDPTFIACTNHPATLYGAHETVYITPLLFFNHSWNSHIQ